MTVFRPVFNTTTMGSGIFPGFRADDPIMTATGRVLPGLSDTGDCFLKMPAPGGVCFVESGDDARGGSQRLDVGMATSMLLAPCVAGLAKSLRDCKTAEEFLPIILRLCRLDHKDTEAVLGEHLQLILHEWRHIPAPDKKIMLQRLSGLDNETYGESVIAFFLKLLDADIDTDSFSIIISKLGAYVDRRPVGSELIRIYIEALSSGDQDRLDAVAPFLTTPSALYLLTDEDILRVRRHLRVLPAWHAPGAEVYEQLHNTPQVRAALLRLLGEIDDPGVGEFLAGQLARDDVSAEEIMAITDVFEKLARRVADDSVAPDVASDNLSDKQLSDIIDQCEKILQGGPKNVTDENIASVEAAIQLLASLKDRVPARVFSILGKMIPESVKGASWLLSGAKSEFRVIDGREHEFWYREGSSSGPIEHHGCSKRCSSARGRFNCIDSKSESAVSSNIEKIHINSSGMRLIQTLLDVLCRCNDPESIRLLFRIYGCFVSKISDEVTLLRKYSSVLIVKSRLDQHRIQCFADESLQLQEKAVYILNQIREWSNKIIANFSEHLHDNPHEKTVPLLLEWAEEGHLEANEWLAKVSHPDLLPDLLEALDQRIDAIEEGSLNREPKLVQDIVHSLTLAVQNYQDPSTLPVLFRLLKKHRTDQSVIALGHVGNRGAIPVLMDELKRPCEPQHKNEILIALRKCLQNGAEKDQGKD